MDKYSGNVGRLVGFNGNIYIYLNTGKSATNGGFRGNINYLGNHLANYHWWVYKPTYSGGGLTLNIFPTNGGILLYPLMIRQTRIYSSFEFLWPVIRGTVLFFGQRTQWSWCFGNFVTRKWMSQETKHDHFFFRILTMKSYSRESTKTRSFGRIDTISGCQVWIPIW